MGQRAGGMDGIGGGSTTKHGGSGGWGQAARWHLGLGEGERPKTLAGRRCCTRKHAVQHGLGRKGGEGGERERVGRGKRYAVGASTYLKSKAKGKYEDGDLRGEARRRPARSDKIAALQRARAHASCMERSTVGAHDSRLHEGRQGKMMSLLQFVDVVVLPEILANSREIPLSEKGVDGGKKWWTAQWASVAPLKNWLSIPPTPPQFQH